MKSYVRDTAMGRMLILFFDKGDLVLENIHEQAKAHGISDAVVLSGIGSFRKLVYHTINGLGDTPDDAFFTIEGAIELGSTQGMILDGKAHLHIVCADLEKTYLGHLEPGCEVQYLMELVLLEMKDAGLTRKPNEYGVNCITEK